MHLLVSTTQGSHGDEKGTLYLRLGRSPVCARRQMEAVDPVPSGPRDPSLWRVKTGHREGQRQSADSAAQGITGGRDRRSCRLKVEYSLTAFGRTLGKALAPLCEWGTRNSS